MYKFLNPYEVVRLKNNYKRLFFYKSINILNRNYDKNYYKIYKLYKKTVNKLSYNNDEIDYLYAIVEPTIIKIFKEDIDTKDYFDDVKDLVNVKDKYNNQNTSIYYEIPQKIINKLIKLTNDIIKDSNVKLHSAELCDIIYNYDGLPEPIVFKSYQASIIEQFQLMEEELLSEDEGDYDRYFIDEDGLPYEQDFEEHYDSYTIVFALEGAKEIVYYNNHINNSLYKTTSVGNVSFMDINYDDNKIMYLTLTGDQIVEFNYLFFYLYIKFLQELKRGDLYI